MSWTIGRWNAVPGFEHGFGGRHDAPPPGLTVLRQVHGRAVHAANEIPASGAEGDGVIVSAGEGAVIRTADCVPVLLLAVDARVAVAVHAGWRGAAAGIVEAALDRLEGEWGVATPDVEAALGPAIDGCCYEVGEEVRDAFVRAGGDVGADADAGFARGPNGRWRLDLRRRLDARLRDRGVGRVEIVGPCTGCTPAELCSYRKEGSGTGRQVSWVRWR